MKYRKGNHEGAFAGIIAGLVLLGGTLTGLATNDIQTLVGSTNSQYITDFMGLIGLVAMIGGLIEYRKIKRPSRR